MKHLLNLSWSLLFFLSLSSDFFTGGKFTSKGVDNDSKNQLHTDNIHNEEYRDIVEPSDVVDVLVITPVTWPQQDVSNRTRRPKILAEKIPWPKGRNCCKALYHIVAHIFSRRLHVVTPESLVHIKEPEQCIKVKQHDSKERGQLQLEFVVGDSPDDILQGVRPVNDI
jgi:hypothetical protein